MSRRKGKPATPTQGAAGEGAEGTTEDVSGEQGDGSADEGDEQDGVDEAIDEGEGAEVDAPQHAKEHDDAGHEQLHRR